VKKPSKVTELNMNFVLLIHVWNIVTRDGDVDMETNVVGKVGVYLIFLFDDRGDVMNILMQVVAILSQELDMIHLVMVVIFISNNVINHLVGWDVDGVRRDVNGV
jgi:hypothetical protein